MHEYACFTAMRDSRLVVEGTEFLTARGTRHGKASPTSAPSRSHSPCQLYLIIISFFRALGNNIICNSAYWSSLIACLYIIGNINYADSGSALR